MVKWCTVTVADGDGKRYSVDVNADSSYDAAHLYLTHVRGPAAGALIGVRSVGRKRDHATGGLSEITPSRRGERALDRAQRRRSSESRSRQASGLTQAAVAA